MPSVPNSGPTAPPPPVWDAQPPEATAARYAGFWLRTVAAIVDCIALAIVWKIVSFFFASPLPPQNPENFDAVIDYINAMMPPGKLVAYTLIVWAYFALQESSSAEATVGKRLLGIRVSTESGARLSLAAASIRAWPMYLGNIAWLASFWLGNLVAFIGFIACISVAFSTRKQGLHDKMARALLTRRQ